MTPRGGTPQSIRIDAGTWPLVVVRWPGGVRTDTEVALALATLRAIAARDAIHAVLVDAPEARPPSPTQLGMILECAREVGPVSRCVATAVVSRSPQVRATVDSIRWLQLTAFCWRHFDDAGEARGWLEARLARAASASGTHPVVEPRAERTASPRPA